MHHIVHVPGLQFSTHQAHQQLQGTQKLEFEKLSSRHLGKESETATITSY